MRGTGEAGEELRIAMLTSSPESREEAAEIVKSRSRRSTPRRPRRLAIVASRPGAASNQKAI